MATYAAVGKRVPRIEGAAKVTGETMYAADMVLPRMVYCKVLRSPYAHAIIKRIDTSKAKAYPRVVGVFTAKDLKGLPKDTPTRAHAVLAKEEAFFYGQPVAAVVAEEVSIAEEALDLIEVEYEEVPAVVDLLAAMEPGSPLARMQLGEIDRSEEAAHTTVTYSTGFGEIEADATTNVTQHLAFTRGDVEKAFAEADVVVERTWRTSMVHQGYIEPQVAIVDYDSMGHYTVWTSTQGQFMVRSQLSNILGVPETRINVIGMEVGGGFGAKIMAFNAALAAFLSKEVKRPVKLVMSRSEDLKAANPAPQSIFEVKVGAKKDGTLTALQARVIFDSGAFPGGPLMAGCNLLGSYYKFTNLDINGYEVITNKASVGALRAPGTPQATFAIESVVDIVARELGMDPLELRSKNAVEEGDLMANGRAYPRIGLKDVIQRIKESNLWKGRNKKASNEGVGVAIGGWLGGVQPANATVALNADGTVKVISGTNDITGVTTSFAQIASEVLGCPVDRVQVEGGDTKTSAWAGVSGGSKTLRTVGNAVHIAASDARDQMFKLAAERLECDPGDLEVADGAVRVKGSPDKALSFQVIGAMTTSFGTPYAPIIGRGSSTALPMAPGFVCQAVRLKVDPDTGEVTLLDTACAQDAGTAINPMSVEGQIQGGVSQSLGMGFTEELQWDEKGRLRNPTLLDYRIPTALDLPRIEAYVVEVPTDQGPFGAKGVGEPPIAAGAAAIVNAIHDAIGVRVSELPATAERILKAQGKV